MSAKSKLLSLSRGQSLETENPEIFVSLAGPGFYFEHWKVAMVGVWETVFLSIGNHEVCNINSLPNPVLNKRSACIFPEK